MVHISDGKMNRKTRMKSNSKLGYDMLKKATASDLVRGGVWYRKDEDGNSFSTVISDPQNEEQMQNFKRVTKQLSLEGRIYLRADMPNYPLSPDMELVTRKRIEKYQ